MKKVILGCLLSVAIGTASAQTDPNTQTTTTTGTTTTQTDRMSQDSTSFWYYPGSNVYHNETTGDYWYFDRPATKWQSGRTLPSNYNVSDTTGRVQINYKGNDVWRDNNTHRMNNKPAKSKSKTTKSSS